MLSLKFYKNPERIGGGITEINYDGQRLIIDMGAELEWQDNKQIDETTIPNSENSYLANLLSQVKQEVEPNPMIEGVTTGKVDCEGVLITHYHGDHMALVKYVLSEVPVYMSKVSKEIGLAIQNRLKKSKRNIADVETIKTLERANTFSYNDFGKDFQIGVFTVRPIRVDHSAFDALAYLITVAEKKIFFTGDFRSHGYTGKALFKTLEHYVGKVDVIITEGTNLNRWKEPITEFELKKKFEEVCKNNKYVLYLGASTNIDSLLSMAYAAKEMQCAFEPDEFQREILDIIAKNSKSDFYKNPLFKFKNVKGLVLPFRLGNLDFAKRFYEKYGEQSVLIYSMWDGYIEKNEEVKKLKELWGNKFVSLHSSGHASAEDIKKMVGICSKGEKGTFVIPMHLENFNDIKALHLPAFVYELHQYENFFLI